VFIVKNDIAADVIELDAINVAEIKHVENICEEDEEVLHQSLDL
jgi:hypothetical protein